MVQIEQCSERQKQVIHRQANTILDRISPAEKENTLVNNLLSVPGIERFTRPDRLPQRLRRRIILMLDGPRELVIDCKPETRCTHIRGRYLSGEREIEMCQLRSGKPALLFHELVHASGGNEFDAEVYENLVFSSTEGSTSPTLSDIHKFERENFEGEYSELDRENMVILNSQNERLSLDPREFLR